MTSEHAPAGLSEQLLGEIDARIVGMQYYDADVGPDEQVNLEREPENPRHADSIRVENGRFQPAGHLPRHMSSWLAPLIDAGKLRVDGLVPRTAKRNDNTCPITVTVYLCQKGRHLLEKTMLWIQAEATVLLAGHHLAIPVQRPRSMAPRWPRTGRRILQTKCVPCSLLP